MSPTFRPHISYSELCSFACECQWKWKLDYLDYARGKEYSVHFDFGTAMHAALEAYFRRKDPISLDHAKKVFTKKFQWLVKKYGPRYEKPLPVKDYTALLGAGVAILDYFKQTPELQDVEVVHNEYKLFEPIHREDGLDIKFKGFIDLVLRGKDKRGNPILWVCDFKTCSWGWDRETREDRWKHFQVFLYKHFLCKKFNIDPKNVRCAFILLKKRPSKNAAPVEWFPVSAGPVSVQRALDTLCSTVTEMFERTKAGTLIKNKPTACTNRYGRTCPYYGTALCP